MSFAGGVLIAIHMAVQAISAEALHRLAEQRMASRGAQRTAADVAAVRAQLQAQEALAEGLRQEAEQMEASWACLSHACALLRPVPTAFLILPART